MKRKVKTIYLFVLSLNEKSGGGSHHNAISFIRLLKKRGHNVVVHTLTDVNNNPPLDIEIIQHSTFLSFASVNKKMALLLNKYEDSSDLFFLYGTDFSWSGGMYRKSGGTVPVIVYLDNYISSMKLGQWQGLTYFLKRFLWDKLVGLRLVGHVDAFFAVSPFLKEKYIEFGFPETRTYVVPNFFELGEDKTNNISISANSGPIRLLYTGRLNYDKGIDLLLKTVLDLPENIDWKLRIVGDGPLKKFCEKYISESEHLSSKVTLVPWLSSEELSKEYQEADVFVHPARWPEPFGRTIVEALKFGVPVVVPENGGASWIAEKGGLTFINGNREYLFKSLLRIITDESLRFELGITGRERIKMFSEEVAGKDFIDKVELFLYSDLT